MSDLTPTFVNQIRDKRVPSTATWFEGSVQELELYDPSGAAEGGSMVWAVWFDAGSRSKPHAHGYDQVLQVIEGEGIFATEESRRRIVPGDWITIPAGLWHWHGATPDSPMCHVTIQTGGQTDWDVDRKNWDDYSI